MPSPLSLLAALAMVAPAAPALLAVAVPPRAAVAVTAPRPAAAAPARLGPVALQAEDPDGGGGFGAIEELLDALDDATARAEQVRIEQHLIIRIAPGPMSRPMLRAPLDPQLLDRSRLETRKFKGCLPVGGIAAVRGAQDNSLLLFLHDQRVISATLAKGCNAADFYMGFYIDHNADGQLCSGREVIHARSGANCTIARMREVTGGE